MKISTIIIIATTTLALVAAAFIANAQKTIAITSSTVINASQEEILQILKSYEQFPEWSPFLVADPEQKHHVTGEDGELGSTFHWEGVGEKSKGSQTLTKVENNYLQMDCTITVPFESNPVFEYYLNSTDKGIEVVQEFQVEVGSFAHFMMKLFGVKKQMTETNALGMQRLKNYVESQSSIAQAE
ncbi:MAG: SRPBCC family protein, partial [Bacteroidota bacterium]